MSPTEVVDDRRHKIVKPGNALSASALEPRQARGTPARGRSSISSSPCCSALAFLVPLVWLVQTCHRQSWNRRQGDIPPSRGIARARSERPHCGSSENDHACKPPKPRLPNHSIALPPSWKRLLYPHQYPASVRQCQTNMKNSQRKILPPLSDSGRHGAVMRLINPNHPITRPQFRAPDDMAIALAQYCHAETRTPSQALTMALRQFIPRKYFDAARKKLQARRVRKKK